MRSALRFLYLWGTIGFAAGTLVLLGPVRRLADHAREAGWPPAAERAAVIATIVLLAAASAAVALRLGRWAAGRIAILAIPGAAAAAALAMWLSPGWAARLGGAAPDDLAGFTFGPYPDRERLDTLRREGYTAVVSLLHPAVVPFEPVLLARERAAAGEAGIPLIHIPLLPWVSGNDEGLARIRDLAADRAGRYYVHCYLGRDRVLLFRRTVAAAGGSVAPGAAPLPTLDNEESFERGPIERLADGVFLTPYPTDDEFVAHVLSGGVAQVVSLLDPDNPDDVQWIRKEEELLRAHGIPYALHPVPHLAPDPERALAAARAVRDLPRPVLVHAFRADGTTARAFREAFLRDRAPGTE